MPCNCEFCIPCSFCGHRADEHMAGDREAGICYVCQANGKECQPHYEDFDLFPQDYGHGEVEENEENK